MNATGRAAVFLDRDGVINRPVVRDGKPFPPATADNFEILPEVSEACRILSRLGPLIVVTNQPDVAGGQMEKAAVEAMHAMMIAALPIVRVEVCFEDGKDPNSAFYKPAPGMLLRAARELNLDLAASVMIGDRWRDIDCGHAAGCLTVWIDRGYDEPLRSPPDHTALNLLDAAQLLVRLGKIPPEAPL